MSGSEMMEEIEEQTDGRWKRGPGSVYPLLAWLQDEGYTRMMPTEEGGMKRYMLTEKGEKLFEEQTKLREKLDFLAPGIFAKLWPEQLQELKEPVRRFARSILELRKNLRENLNEQSIKQIAEFLKNTSEEIEALNKRLTKTGV